MFRSSDVVFVVAVCNFQRLIRRAHTINSLCFYYTLKARPTVCIESEREFLLLLLGLRPRQMQLNILYEISLQMEVREKEEKCIESVIKN
jgi:hypothetical protein